MRIAMIGSRGGGSNYGGIERCLDALCPQLVHLGHEVDIFGAQDIGTLALTGLRNIPTRSFGGKHFSNLSRSALATVRAINHYDVIHFHATGPGILSCLVRWTGHASVATVHALDQNREKWGTVARKALRVAEQVVVHSADELTVVSSSLSAYFTREYQRGVSYIPNGVEAARRPDDRSSLLRRLGLEPGGYLLFAGRMTPEKGLHDLIDAFNGLASPLKLLVAGGNGSQDYIARVRQLADLRRVVFAGHLEGNDLAAAFANAHSFALPSYIEGMSLSLLEAIAYGLPLLVSDIPENRAVCGSVPLYFNAGATDQLRAALTTLCALPRPTRQYCVDSSQLPRWSQVAHQYQAVYERALAKRHAPVHAGVAKLH